MSSSKIWFITGISRGLGKSLAEAVLASGGKVIGTTRNGKSDLPPSANLSVFALDVSDEQNVGKVVQAANAIHGRLDVIVNNAGYSVLGAIEEISGAEARSQLDTCFFGALFVIRSALPILRAQKSGHIMNITSVAGVAPVPSASVYAASKFALEGLSEGLAQEVADFGIKVTVIEPGAFRTDFLTEGSMKVVAPIPAYAESTGKWVDKFKGMNGQQRGNPEAAARIMVQIANEANPPLHLVLGADAFERIEKKLSSRLSELKRLEALTKSTDFGK